jgi:uncharacterized protein YegL
MSEIVLLDRHRGQADDRAVVLPFYLLCDVSYSMESEIGNLNAALFRIRDGLAQQPILADKVRFGVLDFSDDARTVVPLSDFAAVSLPAAPLQTRGATSYAAAFRALQATIDADMAAGDPRFRFFRPAVFFLTDGYPNDHDDWQRAFADLTQYDPATGRGNKRYPLVVPFGFGDADAQLLSTLVHPQNRSNLYMARTIDAAAAIEQMTRAMLVSMLQSGRSASTARPAHVLPTQQDVGPGIDVYPGGDFVS